MRAPSALVLGLLAAPVLAAQAAPAANLVVFRRNQTFGSANYYWNQLQHGAYIQQFPVSSAIVVPAGKTLVVTGLRGGLSGQYGADLSLGFIVAGVHNSVYLRLVRTPVQGSQAFVEFSEHFTTGLSFAAGAQVDLRVTKVSAGSSDTLVNAYLYGYFE
jgi:hypothetical protein